MSKGKIYLSGKITGLLYADAYENFAKAELKMCYDGFDVVNPMNIDHEHDKSWENYMKADIKALMDCSFIYMIKGWRQSKGAVIEYNLAKDLGFTILYENIEEEE